jgi:hypothetical protein
MPWPLHFSYRVDLDTPRTRAVFGHVSFVHVEGLREDFFLIAGQFFGKGLEGGSRG